MVKYWGIPETIVSDRDPRFMGRFWTEVFKLLGSAVDFLGGLVFVNKEGSIQILEKGEMVE